MPGILIKGAEYRGEVVDLYVHDKLVYGDSMSVTLASAESIPSDAQVLEASGLVAVPNMVDDHVHFRDPGFTEKEDLLTGARAAAAGGFVMVNCQPNTNPIMDSSEAIQAFERRVDELHIPIRVTTKCAITKGSAGKELVDFDQLFWSPWGYTDDGEPVLNKQFIITALLATNPYPGRLAFHCEETPRSHERVTAVLGDGPLYQREPDVVRLTVDALKEALKTPEPVTGSYFRIMNLRIQHISMAESLQYISKPKDPGCWAEAEVTPHHLLLCTDDVSLRNGKPDPNWKMSPPLRSRDDMMAMRKALADGLIRWIATDHAPHTVSEKSRSWDEAPFGVIGLETSVGACMSLVHSGELSLDRMINAMSWDWDMLRKDGGPVGITLIDPNHIWTVDPNKFYSKSRNCPFAGMTFKGKPMYTIAGGRLVMAEGEVLF